MFPAREPLALLPSPVHPLVRLRERLGGETRVPALYIKRDDLTGTGLGGNKLRKLEFLVADALASGCDTLVTAGAAQSNHCRLTATVGAMLGLETHLCLRGPKPPVYSGNLTLDGWTKAHLHFTDGTQNVSEFMDEIAHDLYKVGRKPYRIPIGGSNSTGTVGYVKAFGEAVEQLPNVTHMICATGSGGTQAGLVAGAKLAQNSAQKTSVAIWGVGVANPDTTLWNNDAATLATATLLRLGKKQKVASEEVICPMEWMGDRYGEPTEAGQAALSLLARTEGIFLDPVYTAKAFAALLDWIRGGRFAPTDTVLFWHTGGTPALFADGY